MAEQKDYEQVNTAIESEDEEINWLEQWELPIEFPSVNAKEAYKGLIRIYLNTWLSLYNTLKPGGDKYEVKEFKEVSGGPQGFRIVAKLHPRVKRGPHTIGGAVFFH